MADVTTDTGGGSVTYPIAASLDDISTNKKPTNQTGYDSNWYTRWVTASNRPAPGIAPQIVQPTAYPPGYMPTQKTPFDFLREQFADDALQLTIAAMSGARAVAETATAAAAFTPKPVLKTEYYDSILEAEQNNPNYSRTPVESEWQSSIPLFDKNGQIIGYEVRNRSDGFSSQRPTSVPQGKYSQPIMGPSGQIIGYELVDLKMPTPPRAKIYNPSPSDLAVAQQAGAALEGGTGTRLEGPSDYYDAASYAAAMGQASEATFFSNLAKKEQSIPYRAFRASVDYYGDPSVVRDEGGNEKLMWGQYAPQYLGLAQGQIAYMMPERPREDAPMSKWEEYSRQLDAAVSIPMYQEKNVLETLYGLGRKGLTEFQKGLVAAGLYDDETSFTYGLIGGVEQQMMRDIMSYANINGITWEQSRDAIFQAAKEKMARDKAIIAAQGGGGGGGGGGTQVYTQTQYTQTSMAQGRSLLVNVLRDALGRVPTEDEVRRFIQMLNAAESKSPMVSTTTTTRAGDETSAVTRMTPSDVDPQLLAEEFAQDIGGGAEYTSNQANRYMNALMQSLGGSGG
jgi:hypothetical protein